LIVTARPNLSWHYSIFIVPFMNFFWKVWNILSFLLNLWDYKPTRP
jgi:hypothetical protein